MLLSSHQGGVNSYKQHFWTGADSCDLGQHTDHSGSTEVRAENFKLMTWIQDHPRPC